MKNKFYIFVITIFSLISVPALAQTRVITGIVSGENGPLEGISVTVKNNPQNGAVTDAEGRYSITVRPGNHVLEVSGVGYLTKDVTTGTGNKLNITLETDTKGMEEVVVVGYGKQKKINVTASISSVKREEIMQAPSASVQNVLAGRLTGFFSQQRGGQPGRDGAQFFVRGVSTFSGDQSPLILVDDIETSYDDFSNIDPNEVESINILKDAAATAIYGIKGGNGVILVTTRRGKEGSAKINLRTEFGIQKPVHVPKLLDAGNTAMLYNEALKNDAILTGGTYTPMFSDEDIELYRNGQDPYGHPNVDWYNTLIKKSAPMTTNNIDVSGGSNRVQYFLSMGYLSQDGLLKHIQAEGDVNNKYSFNRYNFRSNLDIKATNSLSLKLDVSGNNTVTNAPKFAGVSGSQETAVFYEIYNFESLKPYVYPVYNPDGSFGYSQSSFTPNGLANNIVGRINYGGYTRQLQNLLNGAISAVQKLDAIIPGLQFKALVSVANSNSSTRTAQRDDFPSFYYNPKTDTYTPRDINVYRVSPFSWTYNSGDPRRQTTVQGNLNYDRKFGKHAVTALALFTQNSKSILVTGDNAVAASYIPVKFRGYSGRVTYNYLSRYMVEFNGAYNGTTAFDEKHRWGFFPAASVAWNISEEKFMKDNVQFITSLKLRGSTGVVGSDNLPAGAQNAYKESYDVTTGAYSFGETHNAAIGIAPGFLANENVTWEKERKTNIGLDFSVIKGKLTGAIDVFSNLRWDILTSRNTIPYYFGVPADNLPPENIGRVSNKGYEVELGYNSRVGKDLRLNIRGTYSFAKNKILEMDEVPALYPWKQQTGQPIGMTQQWIWEGFYSVEEAANPAIPKYTGSTTTVPGFLKYRDLNGDGVISDFDKGYFGKPNLPTTVIGLNTGIGYKRLNLSIFLQAALDYDVQIGYNLVAPFKGNLQEIHLKRWTPETAATAEFPALVTNFHGTYQSPGQNSDFWAISGDYLRIKSVELSYRLPEKWINRLGLKSVRAYVNGYNLNTWSKTYSRYQLDPEVARGGGGNDYRGVYPQEAIYNFGFNISIR